MFSQKINEDLEIRQLELSDAAVLLALIDDNRDYLSQWLDQKYVYKNIEEVRQYILVSLLRHAGSHQSQQDRILGKQIGMRYPIGNGAFDAGVWFQGKLAGVVQLHTIDWLKSCTDIGYWLGQAYTGLGLMTTCVRAVVDYAFREYHLKRVIIYCPVDHQKSRAIPERLGFKQERIRSQAERINGYWVDHVVYGIFNHQWKAGINLDAP